MRFLVDECTGPAVARSLREAGHEVFSVFDQARGAADEDVLHIACEGVWILITNDKGSGERVFAGGAPHHGVVLLRLQDDRAPSKIAVLQRLLSQHAAELPGNFAVVSETSVRIVRLRTDQQASQEP